MALTVNRGTSHTIDVVYQEKDSDGEITPRSLVGATVRFTVKNKEADETLTDSTALLLKNVTSHTNAALGLSAIELAPADTQSIAKGKYFYDVKVEESNGEIYKIDEGRFILDASPTNRID